jgi:hypothetical protein
MIFNYFLIYYSLCYCISVLLFYMFFIVFLVIFDIFAFSLFSIAQTLLLSFVFHEVREYVKLYHKTMCTDTAQPVLTFIV